MNIFGANLKISSIFSTKVLVCTYICMLCIQYVAIEGMGISPIKVTLMALAPIIYLYKAPYINKALFWGIALWLCCFFCAYFTNTIRWSSLGYFGMFIFTFICFYSLLRSGEISIEWFANLMKCLIIIFGIVLIMQQISVLAGVTHFPLINLNKTDQYITLQKLPTLTQEPSSTARMIAVFMLAFLECNKLQ